MDPNLTALAAYAGKYEKSLFSTLLNGMDAASDFTVLSTIKSTLKLTKLTVGAGATPYSGDFNPNSGDLEYSGRDLSVFLGKRELLVEPLKYYHTWMSEMTAPGVTQQIPFASYVWAQVFKALNAELNDKTVYFGINKAAVVAYNAGTAYAVGDMMKTTTGTRVDYWKCVAVTTAGQTPTTHPAKWLNINAEAICEGFAAHLAAAITAGSIAPVATGALTSADAYDQCTAVWRAMPVAYRNAGANMYMSYTSGDMLDDSFEEISKFTEKDGAGNLYLAKTGKKCKIIRSTSMGASGRLICTPKENLLIGTDSLADTNKVNTVPDVWTLKAGIAFSMGTQIRDLDAIRVNNVA